MMINKNYLNLLKNGLKKKLTLLLKSLIDLKNLKEKNSSIRALAYQLYENNGVIKREKFQNI